MNRLLHWYGKEGTLAIGVLRNAALAVVLLVGTTLPPVSGAKGKDELPAATSETTEETTTTPGFATRENRYRLQAGDELDVQFRFTPEFNQIVTVQPDGFISLQDAGDLGVGGLTVEEVRQAVVEKYSSSLRDPVVTVVLKKFSMPAFVVGGEVRTPGRYDLGRDVTLTDAIQMAGGFSPAAHTTQVLLFRRISNEWTEVKQVNVKDALKNGLKEDVRLRPGDSIFVPRSKMGKVERFMEVTRLGLFFNPLGFF